MPNLKIENTRDLLQAFDFKQLFIEELGWSQPAQKKVTTIDTGDAVFDLKHIAQLSGVVVIEVVSNDGEIPEASVRAQVHRGVSRFHHENLIIFLNKKRTQSFWYWVKREGNKRIPREHIYMRGQPGDLFLSKLSSMVVDISELDEKGEISVLEVARRLKIALDVETTTKKFFVEYDGLRLQFVELIEGIEDDHKRQWYASVLLNRLMFIYFLQKKFFLDGGNDRYLQQKLEASRERGVNQYYSIFLQKLFFEGFAKPTVDEETFKLIGSIKYLNGGLFIEHAIEGEYKGKIKVPDKAFENLFTLFEKYSWHLDDTPGGNDNEISPDVLGYIFEKYINQKEFGAYYTRPEITEYLCERTISKLILEKVNAQGIGGIKKQFTSLSEMLLTLNAPLCKFLLMDVLPGLSLLDPACGSGAFLVAAMKSLINVYSAIIGRIEFLNDPFLTGWLKKVKHEHPSVGYYIKKRIITENLFGVDIMEEGTEIAKLRLFLALVAAARTVDELEPLPNVDFNILAGNSLIGLMHIEKKTFEESSDLTTQAYYNTYVEKLRERKILVDSYRHASAYAEDLREMRDKITKKDREVSEALDRMLLDQFSVLGIRYEEATWDEKNEKEGKLKRRAVNLNDIRALRPFHWGYEFDEILSKNGGFDAIITNPPWEIFKPQAKEFFMEHSELVTKKTMDIKAFETQMTKLLEDKEIRRAWLTYQNQFPHVSAYYRSSSQYKNQISIVNAKKAGTDINLYKLFVEKCFHLLRLGGECGIVIPSGIYTDLGTKQLREMLFGETRVTGLFCFENSKGIFEGVHRSYKFVVLTFEKGSTTTSFPASFMRHDVEELDQFPNVDSLHIDVELVRKLSPDSLSVMEFKNEMDVQIAKKMLKFPLLGEDVEGKWKLKLTREIDMTNDSHLFKKKPDKGRLPLYEGKMVHQFTHQFAEGRWWVSEKDAREALLGRDEEGSEREMDYQDYRLGFRDVARNTDIRTMISSVIPPNNFAGNTLIAARPFQDKKELLCAVSLLDSFMFDFIIRQKVTAHCNMFYVYQVPVPRLTSGDKYFDAIVERAAKLICITPEFDDLAKEVGLGSYKNGVKDEKERIKLRAELDGMIAHLYGMTEEEFAYILTTFPIVPQPVKDAALEAYREFAPKSDQQEIEALIKAGESAKVEFKSTLRWDMKENRVNKILELVVVKTIAGFLNTEGGTLLIGVEDNKNILGLSADYKVLGKHQDKDGLENLLMTLLLEAYGKDSGPLITTTFHTLNGREICKVEAKPSPKPVFVKDEKSDHLYIRTGNSTRELSPKEAVEYCRVHWK